jgi:hypothetical protein
LRDQVAALTITDEQKEEIIEQQSADLQAMHDDLAKSQRGNFAIAERNKLLEEVGARFSWWTHDLNSH